MKSNSKRKAGRRLGAAPLLGQVQETAKALAEQLGELESKCSEMAEAAEAERFGALEPMLDLDGTTNVVVHDELIRHSAKEDFAAMVGQMLDEDCIPETKAEVVKAWRECLSKELKRIDEWMARNMA
jgi:hypothetical protein